MRSSLPPGKSATPPARCIHRPQRDTSSAGYHLLVSRASAGASRELSSRRSPALAPHTCAVSPTFHKARFFFAASALADVPSAILTFSAPLGRFYDIMFTSCESGAMAQRGEIQCAESQFALQSGRRMKLRNFQVDDTLQRKRNGACLSSCFHRVS